MKVSKVSKKKAGGQCFYTHPPLPLGDGFEVYGGSASTPVVKDAQIYVALDGFSHLKGQIDPWEPGASVNVAFRIDDSYAPKASEVPRFKKMIAWLAGQIKEGKKVHAGCMGGHGRTGLVLAALAATFGHKDAIQYVREHYCTKAVESQEQVDFLVKNFGVEPASANKMYSFDWKNHEPIPGIETGRLSSRGAGLWEPVKPNQYTKYLPPPPASTQITSHRVMPIPSSSRSLYKKA